ncbi:MAG: hypothetical protein Q7J42_00195 [Sulfuritalea sp.]|nr:hypothetical protein [Sulfuritalea sp.]
MELQEAYKQKMAAQLKEWGAQVDLFEAKAENAGADMKVRRAEELDTLRAKQRTAHEKLQDLETASGEAWEQIKETADKIWEDLRTGMADASARFK